MESVSRSTEGESSSEQNQAGISSIKDSKDTSVGTFVCAYCSLNERFDFKGTRPPFARQITYLEECYVMKDPFSLPNRGEALVLGGDCSVCKKSVCLACSVYYGKRFCYKCASDNIEYLPSQLHEKIKSSIKDMDS